MSRFVPNDHAGTRADTAVLLIGTAREFGIDTHDVRIARGRTGFTISDRLAAILDEQFQPKKTSGHRTEKKNSQKGK